MMPQFAQTSPSLNSITSTNISKKTTEELEEEFNEVAKQINLKCNNILQEYEQLHNLDVCINF